LSGHVPFQAGGREWLARRQACRADRRPRHPDRAAALSASKPRRDLRFGRDLLQALLLPRRQDRLDRRRDGAQPRDDEAPLARRRRILPLPARARGRALGYSARPFAGPSSAGSRIKVQSRVKASASIKSLPISAVPGEFDKARLPKAVPVVSALKRMARAVLDCSRLLS